MLGWEFPPMINGGLGVACLGIAKELAKKVDLTLIVPKSSLKFKIENLNLIGLNNQRVADCIAMDELQLEVFDNLYFIDSELNPYAEVNEKDNSDIREKLFNRTETIVEEGNIFEGNDLYGSSLNKMVVEFTHCVLALAEKMSFDIIYAHDWMTFVAGMELKKRSGKPLILHVHSLSYDRLGQESKGWVYAIEKLAMKAADAIIPVSRYTGRICTQYYEVDFKKIFPVHNGVDTFKILKVNKQFEEKVVLFLGRVTTQKGPSAFIEIASKVFEENKNVRFVIAGAGDQLEGLVKLGVNSELKKRVHFTGFLDREKVNTLLAMTDVYCMPSVSEPFGLSALEAAQFGIPTVLTKQSGAAEVLKGALKADYWDVNLMSMHVLALLSDGELRKEVIETSYLDIQKLTWNSSVKKIIDVFDQQRS